MKKILVTMMVFALTIAAQAERIDSTQFVAFYNYTIQTQDDEGQNVTDSTRLALLVGTRATYCFTVSSYNKDGGASQEKLNQFMMLTISGLPCHRATGKLYGKQWTAWYTEEMPSSAGPWKLRGLPGLIIKAEDAEGIHCFELYGTKNEVRDINTIDNPGYQKLSRKKLMDFKKRTLGNPRYVKEPAYYVQDNADDVGEINLNGTTFYVGMNSHMMILQKSHVYKPLELE